MENIVTKRAKSRERLLRNIEVIMGTFRLTVCDIARHIGHDRRYVSLKIKCPHMLTYEDLEGIAEIGGVTVEELMCGDLVKTVRVVDVRKKKKEMLFHMIKLIRKI